MSKLITLYKDILEYASMRPNDKGEIDIVFDDTQKPALVDKKRLMMPSEKNLKHYEPETQIIFHPLQEFVDRGESDVVKRLRQQLNVRINYATFVITTALFRIVASPSMHKDLSPEQRELLLALSKVDGNTEKNYTDFVIKHYGGHENRFFTNVYLKKSGTYQGVKHPRIGVVTFPFYEFLENPELKVRKIDRESFASMLKFVFPDSDTDVEAFNSFSDNHDAPWLNALLKTSYRLTSRINELIELYGEHIPDSETLKFNLGWLEPMDNLKAYRSDILKIPSQRGNGGSVGPEEVVQAAPVAKPQPIPMPAPAQQFQPAPQPTPMPVQPAREQVVYYPGSPGIAPGYYYPSQLSQNPQPMVQQTPVLSKTPDGKLSFQAVERANPMVAASGNIPSPLNPWAGQYAPPMQMQQMVAQGPGIPALAPSGMQPMYQGAMQQQQFMQQQQYQQPGLILPGYVQPLTPQQLMQQQYSQQQQQYLQQGSVFNV
jgi:hypothetical protein